MVIDIYSVLIQSEKTLDSFNEFNELFAKAMEQSEIGICKWNEAGTDIDTALPELLELIDEKEEWRAVIVLTEDQLEEPSKRASDPANPFDYSVNRYEIDPLGECDIPIIRLTHILGGVPAPDVEFECEKIEEPNKAPRMIYKPVKSIEKERLYDQLTEKYSYPGKKPSEIILIALREKLEDSNNDLKQIWETKKEINSSEFWKRNNYPSMCRFIVYDLENQGRTQRYADMFNFWISIMLLITNRINSNVLQAYRLYRIDTVFDKDVMQEEFQRIVYKLTGAYRFIQETVLYEERLKMAEERNLPNYVQEIPVNLEFPRNSSFSVDPNTFDLVCDDGGNDSYKWEMARSEVEENLKKSYRMVERKLDEAADSSKKLCSYPQESVYSLSQYQQEDMNDDLYGLFSMVLSMQKDLPDQKKAVNKRLSEAAKSVKHNISYRLKMGTVTSIFTIVAILLGLSVLPGIIQSASHHSGDLFNTIIWMLVVVATLACTAFLGLVDQKKAFDSDVVKYNGVIKDSLGELSRNADMYSHYISSIVSHSRGKSFLNSLNKKELKNDSARNLNQKNLVEIEKMINKIKKWCVANYLDVDFKSKYYEETFVEKDIASQTIIANIMESSNKYSVDLNHTGDIIESPFEFVTRLEIVREELYDDAQYS